MHVLIPALRKIRNADRCDGSRGLEAEPAPRGLTMLSGPLFRYFCVPRLGLLRLEGIISTFPRPADI